MRELLKATLLGLAIVTVSADVANAATVIDFGTGLAGPGGTVTIGADVTGSGIFIDTVTIVGAPFNNGVYDVDGPGVCPATSDGSCGLLSFDRNLNTIML